MDCLYVNSDVNGSLSGIPNLNLCTYTICTNEPRCQESVVFGKVTKESLNLQAYMVTVEAAI